ncbi:tail fiber protein [Hahella aquimaris]|uniref:phage tail protein n=1 Tax=Hahella sp. HNIBRBA332 TaxID=3015983 RepID=UPI00273CF0B7|nr:tail fiber protein [Hahella sp. HNIBRBA332]WLQ16550.1 tail fiber protein [Hahella sp. HNIBRBA332]
MSEPFYGEIRMFTYQFAPAGWAYCNGQIYPINQNPALFAVIGTLYGGNGSTNFGLPNLEGRTPIAWGTGTGLSGYQPGQSGGSSTIQLTPSQIPSHNHTLSAVTSAGTTPEPGNQLFAYQGGDAQPDYKQPPLGTLVTMSDQMLAITGASAGHENKQPFLSIPFCIALEGVYPPRN